MEKLVLLLLLCESAWAHGTLNKVAKQNLYTLHDSMLYTHWLATGVQHSFVLAYKDIVIIIIIILVIIIRGGRSISYYYYFFFKYQIEKMRQFLFWFSFLLIILMFSWFYRALNDARARTTRLLWVFFPSRSSWTRDLF